MIKNVKKEVTQKRLISVLPSAQKPYVGAYSDLCEMYKYRHASSSLFFPYVCEELRL